MKYIIHTTEEKVKEGEQTIMDNGGKIYTNNSFEINGVEGNYSFDDGSLIINVTDKPWLASWDLIEEKINEFFA